MFDSGYGKRIKTAASQFLNTFSRMCKLREPDEAMVNFYADRLTSSRVHLSHLVNTFTTAYEDFKDSGRYPSPDDLLRLASAEKGAIKKQASGPIQVSSGNRKMLEIFVKAFRESKLKGDDLEKHLNGIVEDNYGKLTTPRKIRCQVCLDVGYVRGWFLHSRGTRESFQKCADGKSRPFHELNRVPNSPVWVQEKQPVVEPPDGQFLDTGIFKCDCDAGSRYSFPRMNVDADLDRFTKSDYRFARDLIFSEPDREGE